MGLVRDMPESEYHAHPAYSRSRISRAATHTPAHYRDFTGKVGSHLSLGQAAHLLLLDPTAFADRVIVKQQCEAVTQAGNQCSKLGQWVAAGSLGVLLCSTHASEGDQQDTEARGLTLLSEADYGTVLAMYRAMEDHPVVQRLLATSVEREVTVIWEEHEVPGSPLCRARVDLVAPHPKHGGRWLWDFKTTRVQLTSDHRVRQEIGKYHYHHQAGWYRQGWTANGQDYDGFGFILQEKKEAPYGVRVVTLPEADVDAGWEQMRDALQTVTICEERGEWPCYPTEVRELSLPDWLLDTTTTYDEE